MPEFLTHIASALRHRLSAQEDSERDLRRAIITASVATVSALALLVIYRIGRFTPLHVCGVLFAGALGVSSFVYALRGKIQTAGSLLLWSILALIEILLWTGGGFYSSALLAIPAILFIASFILQTRSFVFLTSITILSVGALGYVQLEGILMPEHEQSVALSDILARVTILALCAAGCRLLAGAMCRRLSNLEQRTKDLDGQTHTLEKSEDRFRTLFEHANDAILILKGDRFVDCNSMGVAMFGYDDRSEIIGRSPWDLSPLLQPDGENAREKALRIISAALQGDPQRFAWKHSKKDGTLFDAEVSLRGIQAGGEFLIQASVRDVTERKALEDRIRKSEEYYRTLIETSPEAIVILDAKGNLEFASQRAYDLFEVPKDTSVVGMSMLRWVHAEEHAIALAGLADALASTSRAHAREYRLVRHDGSIFYAEVASSPLYASDGQPAGLLLVTRDVSERKSAESALRESKERFTRLADASFEGIVLSRDGTVVDLNPQLAHMLGYQPADMLGMNVSAFVAPESLETVMHHIRSGSEEPYEHLALRKDGSVCPVEVRAKTIASNGGRLRVTAIRDITERKKMEADLRIIWRSVEQSPASIVITDTNGIIQYVNPRFTEVSGYGNEEAIGKNPRILKSEFTKPDDYRQLWDTIVHGGVWRGVFCNRKKNGELYWESASISGVTNERGEITHFVAVKADITEHKQAEDALRQSEEHFRALIDNISDGISVLDGELKTVYRSPSRKRILGYQESEPGGLLDVMHPDDARSYRAALEHMVRTNGPPATAEVRLRHKDGSWRLVEATAKNLLENPAVKGIVVNYYDITEREKIESALQQSEERYRNLVEQSPDGVYRSTHEGKFLEVNQAMVDILGYASKEELMAIDIKADLYFNLKDRDSAALEEKREEMAIFRLRKKDGSEVWVEDHGRHVVDAKGSVLYHEGILRDITARLEAEEERKLLEEQLFQAQRMESIGTLAAGIAHDFNNILNLVRGNAELLSLKRDDKNKFVHRLDNITRATERGAQLVKQLLTFARKTEIVERSIEVNALILETADLLEETFPRNIELTLNLGPQLLDIVGDGNQLHQVLVNLCVNARDAMPDGGTLTISTECISGELARKKIPAAGASQYVVVSVKDTGLGMDEDIRKRIFDPFFTTKKPEKGTGLGLAVVLGIISKHHGHIDVRSTPGVGTEFLLYLPGVSSVATSEAAAEASALPKGNAEAILLIEDEPGVQEIVSEYLKSYDYVVYATGDGEEGLKTLTEHLSEIRLVITDLSLPKRDGVDVCRQARLLNPRIPLLVVSGFADPEASLQLSEVGIDGFIQKPYRLEEILMKIKSALSAEGASR